MSLKIAIIISTTRESRAGKSIADWAVKQLPKDENVVYDVIDLKEENLPLLNEPKSPMMGDYQLETTKTWSKKIASYDGYIIVTAEYNHGYPAPLKNALDSLYHEWSKKPVAFVGYGSLGAARAIEQLSQVASQLNMVPLSSTGSTVRIIDVWEAIDEAGNVKPEYVRGSLESLTQGLLWWANVLKPAREQG